MRFWCAWSERLRRAPGAGWCAGNESGDIFGEQEEAGGSWASCPLNKQMASARSMKKNYILLLWLLPNGRRRAYVVTTACSSEWPEAGPSGCEGGFVLFTRRTRLPWRTGHSRWLQHLHKNPWGLPGADPWASKSRLAGNSY